MFGLVKGGCCFKVEDPSNATVLLAMLTETPMPLPARQEQGSGSKASCFLTHSSAPWVGGRKVRGEMMPKLGTADLRQGSRLEPEDAKTSHKLKGRFQLLQCLWAMGVAFLILLFEPVSSFLKQDLIISQHCSDN